MKDKEKYELAAQQFWAEYKWDETMRALREYWIEFRRYDLLLEHFRPLDGPMMDVGCGPTSVMNLLVSDLPENQLVGLDPLVDEYAKLCPREPGIHWANALCEEIPFNDGHFAGIVSSNAMDHVENIDGAFDELARVTRKGGKLFMLVHVFGDHTGFRNVGHPFSPTPHGLGNLLGRVGFELKAYELFQDTPGGLEQWTEWRLRKNLPAWAIKNTRGMRNRARNTAKQLMNKGHLGDGLFICERV